MKVLLSIISSIILLFFIGSCNKAPQGISGPNGLPGTTGPNASFDIYYDSISPVPKPSTGWSNDSINGTYFDHIFTVPVLIEPTSDKIQPPVVKVYYSKTNGDDYYPLPQYNIYIATDKLEYSFSTGKVYVTYYNSAMNYPAETIYIKIVVIPVP